MQQITLIRVFLASPSDVAEERRLVREVIAEVNATVGDQHHVRLEAVGWETHTFAAFGAEPQALIFQQINMNDFDLFVGVMWNRFGTPTTVAGSGTEEEFRAAVACRERLGRPDIMFYFCRGPAELSESELEQRRLVLQFKSQIQSKGLTKDYVNAAEFKDKLRGDLLLWLGGLSKNGRIVQNGPGALLDSVVNTIEFAHLNHLVAAGPFRVHFQEGFRKELEHLRSLNFIKSVHPDRGLRSIPRQGEFDLKEFFEITRRGRDYLLLRSMPA